MRDERVVLRLGICRWFVYICIVWSIYVKVVVWSFLVGMVCVDL